jgi:hypothetical protein
LRWLRVWTFSPCWRRVRYHLHGPRSPAQKQLRLVPEREVPAAGAKAAIPEVEAAEVAPGATGAPTEKKTTLVKNNKGVAVTKSFPVRLAEFLKGIVANSSKVLVEGQLVQPPEGKNQKVEFLVENILHVGTVNAAKYPIAKVKVALCVVKEKVVSAVVQLHPGAVEACDYAQVAVGFTSHPEIERWHEIPALFVETLVKERREVALKEDTVFETMKPLVAEVGGAIVEEFELLEGEAVEVVATEEAVPAAPPAMGTPKFYPADDVKTSLHENKVVNALKLRSMVSR